MMIPATPSNPSIPYVQHQQGFDWYKIWKVGIQPIKMMKSLGDMKNGF